MSGESVLSQVLFAVWFILPAYLSNGAALVIGGGPPIDGGWVLRDGRRLLGDGVTIRGTAGGIVAGTVVGGIQGILVSEPIFGLGLGLVMGAGAMVGDMFGSFLKRRIGIARGRPAPLLDQVGFLVFALGFAALITPVSSITVLILLILTPTIHISTNAIAFQLGLKRVWY